MQRAGHFLRPWSVQCWGDLLSAAGAGGVQRRAVRGVGACVYGSREGAGLQRHTDRAMPAFAQAPHPPHRLLLQVRLVCSNNDDTVRAFDAETFQLVRCVPPMC